MPLTPLAVAILPSMWLLCAILVGLAVILVGLALLWGFVRRAWHRQITEEEAILVTGCDSGFGLDIAKALAERTEATVFAGYVTDAGRAQLDSFGDRVKPLRLDVTQQTEVAAAFQALSQSGKTLWGVVNNAGIGYIMKPLLEVTETDSDAVIDVNLKGPFLVAQIGRAHV